MKIKRILPDGCLIQAGIDTSTLIRLFLGDWHGIEFKIYQNFFQIHVSKTVLKEFEYFRKFEHSLKLKYEFLALLGVKILKNEGHHENFRDNDELIVQECMSHGLNMLITDNVAHFQALQQKYLSLKVVNGFSIPYYFFPFMNHDEKVGTCLHNGIITLL
ncbi:MAG: hypothetical protein EAX96_14405 [Candidatus Lokiarchaeota archaeon]|nr:hypothetical protein [Candidatus Lokiarchaeota archaeon]